MGQAMIRHITRGVFAALAACAVPGVAMAQDMDGAALYERYCASCHGLSGIGDGPVGEMLRSPPPSLATLALRNGGVFPVDTVRQIVDGRGDKRTSRVGDMPVFGMHFGSLAQWQHPAAPDHETAIGRQIGALVDHVQSLQIAYISSGGDESLTDGFALRHANALRARDLQAILLDYADDAVLILPTGTLAGKGYVEGYYKALFEKFSAPGAAFHILDQSVTGSVARVAWSGKTDGTVFQHGSDTFAVEGGKIRYQIVGYKVVAR